MTILSFLCIFYRQKEKIKFLPTLKRMSKKHISWPDEINLKTYMKNLLLIMPGGHSGEVIPVPIPNTEVKLSYADDTAAKWESR